MGDVGEEELYTLHRQNKGFQFARALCHRETSHCRTDDAVRDTISVSFGMTKQEENDAQQSMEDEIELRKRKKKSRKRKKKKKKKNKKKKKSRKK